MSAASLPLTPALRQQLRDWLQEDLGRGDLSAPALAAGRCRAHWISKAPGVFCGGPFLDVVFRELDPTASVELLVADGDVVSPGQRLVNLEAEAAALVAAERTALNLAMRLSGIATATARLVAELDGSGVRLADTRKTTPGQIGRAHV